MSIHFWKNEYQFLEELLAVKMGKTETKMKTSVYLRQAIADLRKKSMYKFYYDYMCPKCGDKVNVCYMATGSFVF